MEKTKNCWVIPTDKPSRLWINNLLQGKLELSKEVLPYNTSRNIYITSDEEIKEGDWVYNNKENIVEQITSKTQLIFVLEENKENQTFKKIILTTNDQLIKDGVQAIDDEFLEWFCSKNGKVDFVEVIVIKDEKN